MKFDVILVLGRGLNKDSSLFESSKVCTEKAADLFNAKYACKIIFSGKYSYKLDFTPTTTEAEAMADYAKKELNIPDEAIIIENRSVSTVTNLIYSKKILEKNNWKKVIVIYIDPFKTRTIVNLDKILGKSYTYELIKGDFEFDSEKKCRLIEQEKIKVEEAKDFLNQFEDGDDRAVLKEVKKFHEKLGQSI